MSSISAEIKKVIEVLDQNLNIPYYQRPYRWKEKNVNQLLEDIYSSWKNVKSAYRIGSVILHQKSKMSVDIIDGQQRLTTLVLLMHNLGCKQATELIQRFQFAHADSEINIRQNYQFIASWLANTIPNEGKNFLNYITKFCEFVEIKVAEKELSQAFQMFDSQNTRGKHLEAYNLLKAYHIRAMEEAPEQDKIESDRRWENATRYVQDPLGNETPQDLLKQLFNEQLFRTRIWSRKYSAYRFSKEDIDEFKGQTINSKEGIGYPFLNKDLMHSIALNYFDSLSLNVKGVKSRFRNAQVSNMIDYVSINQSIINGKAFFDYVETYVEMYKQLFIADAMNGNLTEFKEFYADACNYKGSHRQGDQYLKELYKSAIMMLFDKFGEDGVNKFFKTLYAIIYRLRLEKWQVRYAAAAKYPKESNLFAIIEESKNYFDLRKLEKIARKEIEKKRHIHEIENIMDELGVEIIDKVNM
jgi:uncharacterized protein with ParB-like and HNH nuclease domain